ncbi:hypothetical protein [Dactylosporangium sp. CA-092794]|uniref:hypothetical protein n=1 Tax=Dactylosporangium sp. CA-092794 TaxID=3239929 RepID=UPI003D906633
MDTEPPDDVRMAEDDPFGALARELTEFDYVAGDTVDGITPHAHPHGGAILATIDRTGQEARLARCDADGETLWTVRFTAAVPPPVQLVILSAVLHAHLDDEQAILTRASGLLGLRPAQR